ncbi:MAG: DUF2442 domain-containing protein [Acidobacteria bacterium]|nr:DUF2442 domain-containing protein [Acidobacteriota bacterium]
MVKLKMSDEEFERQYREAVKRGEESMKTEPQARSARYDHESDRLIIELKNGATFMIPCDLVQGLRGADPELVAEVELLPRGAALHWKTLDVDFSVAGLLMGLFGTKTWMSELGRQGGSVRSEVKAAAVRENGKKGGRPRTKERGKKAS